MSLCIGISQAVFAFDFEQTSKYLDELEQKVVKNVFKMDHAKSEQAKLVSYRQDAEQCVKTIDSELPDLDKRLSELESNREEQKNLPEHKYLKERHKKLVTRQSECRLLIIRIDEQTVSLKQLLQEQTQNKLFLRNADIINHIPYVLNHIDEIPWTSFWDSKLSWKENIGITSRATVAIPFLLLALLIGTILRLYSSKIIYPAKTHYSRQLLKNILLSISLYGIYLLPISTILMFVFFSNPESFDQIQGFYMFKYLTYWVLGMMVSSVFFKLPNYDKNLLKVSSRRARIMHYLTLSFVLNLLLMDFIFVEEQRETIPIKWFDAAESILIIISSISLFVWVNVLANHYSIKYEKSIYSAISTIFFGALLFSNIFINFMGYQNFSLFFTKGLILTTALTTVIVLLDAANEYFFNRVNFDHFRFSSIIRARLGLTKKKNVVEAYLLRIANRFMLVLVYAYILLSYWNHTNYDHHKVFQAVSAGFNLSALHVSPVNILMGVYAFSFFSLLTRFIRTKYRVHERSASSSHDEIGADEAIAIIIGHIGFFVALIIALVVIGLDLTSITVIAGALSVGIGFGLQHIVNNFVSGIILLVERPIKIGDRVLIDGHEGFVEKVSFRATRVKTLRRTDIIIPNSEILDAKVINYMYSDNKYRISVEVTVASDADIELVRKTLYQIANEHPDIIDSGSDGPTVFFKEIEDKGLCFSLWCVVNNVQLRFIAKSDLNFQITKRFNEMGIEIAFPRRDIRIRSEVDNAQPPALAPPQTD